jgi:hypothetical protein
VHVPDWRQGEINLYGRSFVCEREIQTAGHNATLSIGCLNHEQSLLVCLYCICDSLGRANDLIGVIVRRTIGAHYSICTL